MLKSNEKIPRFMYEGQLMKKAIEKWGADAQMNQTIEECAELIVSLNHFRRGRTSHKNVQKEMADVQIMIEQMITIFGEDGFQKAYDENLKELGKRLNESI